MLPLWILSERLCGILASVRFATGFWFDLEATAAPICTPTPAAGVASEAGPAMGSTGPTRAPRASDFLTKGEIMYLFVVPGLDSVFLQALYIFPSSQNPNDSYLNI